MGARAPTQTHSTDMWDILLGHSVSQSFSQSIKPGRQLKFHCPLSEAKGNRNNKKHREKREINTSNGLANKPRVQKGIGS